MIGYLQSIPGQKSGPRQRRPAGTSHVRPPLLAIVRSPAAQYVPRHSGMWHEDGLPDSILHTSLEDWPADHEFEPLIAGAWAAGDYGLVTQLEYDRAFCAAARAQLADLGALPRDSSA